MAEPLPFPETQGPLPEGVEEVIRSIPPHIGVTGDALRTVIRQALHAERSAASETERNAVIEACALAAENARGPEFTLAGVATAIRALKNAAPQETPPSANRVRTSPDEERASGAASTPSAESATPRTDAVVNSLKFGLSTFGAEQLAGLARQLETELWAATKARDALAKAYVAERAELLSARSSARLTGDLGETVIQLFNDIENNAAVGEPDWYGISRRIKEVMLAIRLGTAPAAPVAPCPCGPADRIECGNHPHDPMRPTNCVLRSSAAPAEQAPVAWRWRYNGGDEPGLWSYREDKPKLSGKHVTVEPLYNAPRSARGTT